MVSKVTRMPLHLTGNQKEPRFRNKGYGDKDLAEMRQLLSVFFFCRLLPMIDGVYELRAHGEKSEGSKPELLRTLESPICKAGH